MPDLSDLADEYMSKPRSTDLEEFAGQFIDVARLMDMAKHASDEDVYHRCLIWLSDSLRHTQQHFAPTDFTLAVVRRRRNEETFT